MQIHRIEVVIVYTHLCIYIHIHYNQYFYNAHYLTDLLLRKNVQFNI